MRFLRDAERALPGAPEEALAALLEAYREGPCGALADVVVALSEATSAARAPLDEGNPSERALEERWSRIYKRGDMADIARLLGTVLAGTPATVDKRLMRLGRGRSRDPRISRWIIRTIRCGELSAKADDVKMGVCRLTWAMSDPTTALELVALTDDPDVKRAMGSSWCESVARAAQGAGRVYVSKPDQTALLATIEGLVATAITKLARSPRRSFTEEEGAREDAAATAREAVRQTGEVDHAAAPLTAALAQLEAGADPLSSLLEAWQRTRDVRLANLVDLASAITSASAAATGARPPLAEKPVAKAVAAWIEVERAGEPVDLPRLLDGLLIGNSLQIRTKIQQLEKSRDDPRVARRLVHVLEVQPFTASSAFAAYSAAFRLLAALGDDRAIPRLEAIAAALPPVTLTGGRNFAEKLASGIRSTITKLRARKRPELDAATMKLVERLSTELMQRVSLRASDGSAADALLAAIWGDPRADAPRLVYADWLLERGSPHGELIVLQIGGARDARAVHRVTALLERHGRSFLGPLEPAIEPGGVRFERGFVTHCELVARPAPGVDAVSKHPAWSTVQTFALAEPCAPERQRLVDHLLALDAKRVEAI